MVCSNMMANVDKVNIANPQIQSMSGIWRSLMKSLTLIMKSQSNGENIEKKDLEESEIS